jgi:hypothetical protein
LWLADGWSQILATATATLGRDDGDNRKGRGGEAENLNGLVSDEEGKEFISGREEVGVSRE